VEYADIFGIPFDFTAKPSPPTPIPPKQTIHVRAVTPERDKLEIRFPRVAGYRAELPEERLTALFTEDSTLLLTPEIVGPTKVKSSGIIGESADFDVQHLEKTREAEIIYKLTKRLLDTKFRDENGELKLHLFGQLKKICAQWYSDHLVCKGGVYPAMILYQYLADIACERIEKAISSHFLDEGKKPVMAILDPYNKEGSSIHVNFHTSKTRRWQTDSRKCHVNWALADSDWELEFCRLVEDNSHVIAYVKNSGLGFEVPYRLGSENRIYLPDYIVLVDDGRGPENPLHLIIEVKGYRKEDAKDKRLTMENFWVPGVNYLGLYGRWAFAEFTEVFDMQEGFDGLVEGFVRGERI
jgi:type III restriction enzyme